MSSFEENNKKVNSTPHVFVYIVESPSPDDLLESVSEGHLIKESLKLAGISAVLSLAVDFQSFLKALYPRLHETLVKLNGIPILHLSAHGNEKGIELTDKRFIDWDELRKLLIPLNRILGGALILCMSSCSGLHGLRMVMSEEKEDPFIAIVCNTGTPNWSDTAVAFIAFYHRLFEHASLPDAINAMCAASGDNGFIVEFAPTVKKEWIELVQKQRWEQVAKGLEKLLKEHPVA
jgi:hypothetical protein